MIRCYSRKADGEKRLSTHFCVREFACRDGSDAVYVDDELVAVLQALRSYFGRPVIVTSGYRTAAHNRAVGGSAHSQHLYGRAADVRIAGVSVERAASVAETLLAGRGGIGRYPPGPGRKTGWLHLDVRSRKSRWTL